MESHEQTGTIRGMEEVIIESTSKQATLIYNPVSGSAQIEAKLERFSDEWRLHGWQICIEKTAYAEHGIELARAAAAKGHKIVIAAGGDGTIRDVIQGLVGSDAILAILPCGTGNTFARDLNLTAHSRRSEHYAEMARRLLGGVVQKLDVGLCNGDLTWFMTLGVGVDSLAVQEIEPRNYKSWVSRRFNKLIYVYKGLKSLRTFPGMQATVVVDEQTVSGEFVLITVNNTRRYAGYVLLNPDALLDDGLVEVWMLCGRRKRDMIKHFLRIVFGRQGASHKDVMMLQGKQIRIEVSEQMPFQYDGDLGGSGVFETEMRQQVVRVLVPDEAVVTDLFSEDGVKLS